MIVVCGEEYCWSLRLRLEPGSIATTLFDSKLRTLLTMLARNFGAQVYGIGNRANARRPSFLVEIHAGTGS